ncbi:MAG: class II glutamine amidotransferase [Rhodospirillales bacterium]|nr:class II glutamine amidotransferase [Alphaproteobacteria bacterium]MBL6957776.1 class II glutamine amidotransferase [Rhodospirillales bacterium]
MDDELTVDFRKQTSAHDVVTVIATRPLTDNENWTVMEKDSFVVFRDGLSHTL